MIANERFPFQGKSIFVSEMQLSACGGSPELVLRFSHENHKYGILFRNASRICLRDFSYPLQICDLEIIDNADAGYDRDSRYMVQDADDQKIRFYCEECLIASLELYTATLEEILEDADRELRLIQAGGDSLWNSGLLKDVVIPEMSQLLINAKKGLVSHKHGKSRLASIWHLTDSFEPIHATPLGRKICRLDDMYHAL